MMGHCRVQSFAFGPFLSFFFSRSTAMIANFLQTSGQWLQQWAMGHNIKFINSYRMFIPTMAPAMAQPPRSHLGVI